jgi:hypothetical protein
VETKNRILLKLKTMMLRVATMDAWPKDPDPKNWRTIEGTHVHLKNGKIDGGAGGKFNGHYWTSKTKHEFIGPKIPAQMEGAPVEGWKTAAVPKPPKKSPAKKRTRTSGLLRGEEAVKKVSSLKPGSVIQITMTRKNEDGTERIKKGKFTLMYKHYAMGTALAWVRTTGSIPIWDFGTNVATLKSEFGDDKYYAVKIIKDKEQEEGISSKKETKEVKDPAKTSNVDFKEMEASYYAYNRETRDSDERAALYKKFVNDFCKKADDATIVKFFQKHPPKTMKNFDKAIEKGENAKFEFDTHPTDTQMQELRSFTKTALEKGAFAMKIDSAYLENVIDDWFKNQFETNTSGGNLNHRIRAKASNQMFCTKTMKGYEREKYGYLASPDVHNDSGPNWYGNDCTVRFKKERLRGRATYTMGDSLDCGAEYGMIHPGDAFSPGTKGLVGFDVDFEAKYAKEVLEKARTLKIPPDCPSDAVLGDYFELQYHGPLTIYDVDSVVLGENHKVSNKYIKIMKKLV